MTYLSTFLALINSSGPFPEYVVQRGFSYEMTIKAEDYFRTNKTVTDDQAKRIGEYMAAIHSVCAMRLWVVLQTASNSHGNDCDLLWQIHPYVGDLLISLATASDPNKKLEYDLVNEWFDVQNAHKNWLRKNGFI